MKPDKALERIWDIGTHIIERLSIHLKPLGGDIGDVPRPLPGETGRAVRSAVYGHTSRRPPDFAATGSSLSGSFFHGAVDVENSILWECDIRGDELKEEGSPLHVGDTRLTLVRDERFHIRDCWLVRTLVHNNSPDIRNPEEFRIHKTVAMPYANIHGAPVEGSYLGPYSTVDLTSVHDSWVGAFAYVQVGELRRQVIEPGLIWVRSEGAFEFRYRYPEDVLSRFLRHVPGREVEGVFATRARGPAGEIEFRYRSVPAGAAVETPQYSYVSPYAVLQGRCRLGRNVFVSQGAYVADSDLGHGANVQENCFLSDVVLAGLNVNAHGVRIQNAELGERVFCGFNSYLHGPEDGFLTIGEGTIVMPHTIIEATASLEIPGHRLVWGHITNAGDLEAQSIALDRLSEVRGELRVGDMRFNGRGADFVTGFQQRIEHILEENGAFYDGSTGKGHAQNTIPMSFSILQPYTEGELRGLHPAIVIRPF